MATVGHREPRLLACAVDFVRLCMWLLILMIVFVPLERLCALHPQKVFRKAFLTDVAYCFLSGLLPKLLLVPSMAVAPGGGRLFVSPELHLPGAAFPSLA